MKKILLIGFKDVTLAFRDRAALVLMLLAPFLLTLGLGVVTGRFSGGGGSGLSTIPVILVNQDSGELGQALVDLFQSEDLAGLVEPVVLEDPGEAERQVIADEAAAAVIIPSGFTGSILPQVGQSAAAETVKIDIIANPARPTSAGVVQTIVEAFSGQVELGRIGAEVTIVGMLEQGLIAPDPETIAATGQMLGEALAVETNPETAITINPLTTDEEAVEFDILAYLAPGMALMFLMFTVSYGGRSFLDERAMGTLPRLMVSPTTTTQVLAGKVFGTYLTGVVQLAILIGATSLLFSVHWGDLTGVVALILAAVFGATGWGMLLTAVARSPGQINSIGSTLMLMFGILGGSFISLDNMPTAVQWISRITPNAWGLDGFTTLALGGSLPDLLAPLAALVVMGVVLFGAAVLLFNRQGVLQN
jgi:ABC-2 type transport system permease protein